MSQLIQTGAGAVEYVDAVIPLDDAGTFTGTVQLGVGDYGTPPAAWQAPDRQVTAADGKSITASMLIGSGHVNPVVGTYWLWYRVIDNPEVIIGPARASRFETTDAAGSPIDTQGGYVAALTAADGTITLGGSAQTPTIQVTPGTFDAAGAASGAQAAAESYTDTAIGARALRYDQTQALTSGQQTQVQDNLGLPGVLSGYVSSSVAAQSYLPVGASQVAAMLPGQLLAVDDFQRSDRSLQGDTAPSGQPWFIEGHPAQNVISGGRYVPIVNPADPEIIHLPLSANPDGLAVEWVYVDDGTTRNQDVVLGTCAQGFSLGSIQLSMAFTTTNGGYDWNLFNYPTSIQSGKLLTGFAFQAGVRYRMSMLRTAADTVQLRLPDGQLVTVKDASIAAQWGNLGSTQVRRPNATDGHIQVTAFAASQLVIPAVSGTSGIRLPGSANTYLASRQPTWVSPDIDVVAYLAADSWTAPSGDLVSCWGGAGDRRFFLLLTSAGQLTLTAQVAGVNTGSHSTNVLPATAGKGMWVRATRVASTGTIQYFYSNNPPSTAVGSVAWTKLGNDVASTIGNPDTAPTAALNIGAADSITTSFAGVVSYAHVADGVGGTILAGVDLRQPWTGRGIAGERWGIAGSGWSFTAASNTSYGTLANRPAAGSVSDGTLYVASDQNGGTPYQAQSGAWVQVADSVTQPSGRLVYEIDTEYDYANNNVATIYATAPNLGAGSLVAGQTLLRIRQGGSFDSITSGGTFVVYVFVNGVNVGSATLCVSQSAQRAGKLWWFDADLYVDAIGSGGAVSLLGNATSYNSAGTATPFPIANPGVPVDLSSGLVVTLKASTATADPGNVLRVFRAQIQQVA